MPVEIEPATHVRTKAGGDKKPPKPPVRVATVPADEEPRPFGWPLLGYRPKGVE